MALLAPHVGALRRKAIELRWREQKHWNFNFFCSHAVEASLRPRFFSCGRNFVPLALWTADASSARC